MTEQEILRRRIVRHRVKGESTRVHRYEPHYEPQDAPRNENNEQPATIEEFLKAKRIGAPLTGKGRSQLTLKSLSYRLHRVEELMGVPLGVATKADIRRLLEAFEEHDLEPSTRNALLSALHGFYDWAIGTGRYRGNHPTRNIRSFKLEERVPALLTKEQLRDFFAWIDENYGDKYSLLFRTMFYGGLRSEEVLGLKKRDIKEDHIVVHGKNGKDRIVPLPASLIDSLRWWVQRPDAEPGPYVFGGRGGGALSYSRLIGIFHEAVRALKLDNRVTPHTLRHTAATLFLEKTGDLSAVQDFLGHSTPLTTRRYAQMSQDRLKEQYNRALGSEDI